MIPAKPNTYAYFIDQYAQGIGRICAEVVAWDSDGHPMVQGQHGLSPVIPSYIKNITTDEPAQFESYVQFTPVEDLFALYRALPDADLYEKPLVGWAVTGGGDIVPVAEEPGDGIIAVSRDDDYVLAFRGPDRERVYAEHRLTA